MKNFDWTKFRLKTAVKSGLNIIYYAWTEVDEIEKWFLKKAVFYDEEGNEISRSTSVEEGYTYKWNWYLYNETEKGRITKANGIDHIQFTFAGNCIVDIKLERQDEYTIIELEQSNIPEDDVSKKNIRLGCESGWSFYLINLKAYCEYGIDLRNKEEKLGVLVNN